MVKTPTLDYESTSKTNILELPKDCLLSILRYISLREVLICRQVCHQWLDAVHKFGKSLHTLRLFHNFFDQPDSEAYFETLYDSNLQNDPEFAFNCFNTLVLEPIVTELGVHSHERHFRRWRKGKKDYGGRFLAKLFPNVHNLVLSFVFHHGHNTEPHFYMDNAYLLRKWRHSLQSLTIFGLPLYFDLVDDYAQKHMMVPDETLEEHRKSIYGAVNSCTKLTRLHLFNFDEVYDFFDLAQCPALHAQLEAYSWNNRYGFEPIEKCMLTSVKSLRGKLTFDSDSIREIYQNVCELSINCTNYQWKYLTEDYMAWCTLHFPNLAYLDISTHELLTAKDISLKDLTKSLAKLTKFVHLKLSARLILTDLNGLTEKDLCEIPKLSSITTLHLVDHQTVLLKEYALLHYEFLADKFPSVRTIHISCRVNLLKLKYKAKMKENFVKHFGADRLSEIKFFKFTRFQDAIKVDKTYI